MTTTITATPQPDTASVRLNIATDALSSPQVILDLTAAAIKAESTSLWSGSWSSCDLFGSLVSFYSTATYGTARRTLTGLVIGSSYTVEIKAERSTYTTFEVLGKGSSAIPSGSGVWSHTLTFTATATSHVLSINTVFNNLPYIQNIKVSLIPPAYSFSLTRSDANGIVPVRLFEGQGISGGALIVTDYEPSLTGPLTYTVNTTTAATVTTTLALQETWLTVPVAPQYSAQADLVTGLTSARETTTTVHKIINRPDPILTLGALRLRSGSLTVWCPSYAVGRTLEAVYGRGEIVMLRQSDYAGLDMFHAATGNVSLALEDTMTPTRRWLLSVDYTEVKRPSGALTGAIGWTYAASTARNATYGASALEFPTYGDLLIGPL